MASSSNPSSKKKSSSSSSHKKKPSKKSSSEVRKKKRSRSRKRDKLRKRSRRELSVSCTDVSRSEDSVSASFSDSEEDYSRRKGRSRTRVDEKESRKKDKRTVTPSVRDDNRESVMRKKRKESRGSDVSEVKKKYQHGKSRKEGSRRGVRVDYFSGGSESCSTCHGGSDSEDSGFKRSRRRSKGSEKNKTRKGRDKDRAKDRRRSRSCSSRSEHNEQSRYQSEEILMDENYPRRLKSVLSVPNEYEEDRYQGMNENTEEVILAYDDCPSSKSNDSYEGGRKKDTFNQPYSVPEKRWEYDGIVEDDKRADTSYLMDEKEINNGKKVVDAITSKSKIQSARNSKGDVGAQYDKIDHVSSMESSKVADDGNISTGDGSAVAGDLETILRQKALENFRKFRGVRQANTNIDNQKNGNNIGVKQLHKLEHEPIKTVFGRKSDDRVAVSKDVEPLESGNRARVEGKSGNNSTTHGFKTPAGNSKLDFCIAANADDSVVDAKATQKRIINLGKIGKSYQDSLVDRRESSVQPVVKQVFPDRKLKDANTVANKFVPETSNIATGSLVPCETNQSRGSISSEAKPIVNKITPEPYKVAVGSSDPNKTDKSIGSTTSETKSIVNKIIPDSFKVAVGNSDPSKSDKAPMSTSSEATSIVNKVISEPPEVTGGSSDTSKTDKSPVAVASEATSCVRPGEHGSTELEKTAAGGSGFEQKTMTVMRGGEMVQVSYKVYIPKKTPALARRQLRR